jgi:hypothetical protein
MSEGTKPNHDEVIFSLSDGVVWASWPEKTGWVELGPYESVIYMMRNFLAQCEVGERMAAKGISLREDDTRRSGSTATS